MSFQDIKFTSYFGGLSPSSKPPDERGKQLSLYEASRKKSIILAKAREAVVSPTNIVSVSPRRGLPSKSNYPHMITQQESVSPRRRPPSKSNYPHMITQQDSFRSRKVGDEDRPTEIPLSFSVIETMSARQSSHTAQECQRESQKAKKRSTFSQLMHETQQFQKIVSDLERILTGKAKKAEVVGENPEATWRARILIRSAEDADKDLSLKLKSYERLLARASSRHKNDNSEHRKSQTACVKLQRDFQRSHNALMNQLHAYEKRQQAEISQLGSVGFNLPPNAPNEEDFFDRAVRQRELDQVNVKMHKVNQIYRDLAAVVDIQQDQIDFLEREAYTAAANVEAAAQNMKCHREVRDNFACTDESPYPSHFASCGAIPTLSGLARGADYFSHKSQSFEDSFVSITDDETNLTLHQSSSYNRYSGRMYSESDEFESLDVSDSFHWYMPFENLKEDISLVKKDIVSVGKEVMSKSKRLNCGAMA